MKINDLKKQFPKIDLALILGSGLGGFEELLNNKTEIKYNDIPNYPKSTVSGHKGSLFIGEIDDKVIAVFSGRAHLYEGYSAKDVVANISLSHGLGIDTIIITNAAGGITYGPGAVVALTDHINLTNENPLHGKNDDSLGPRFPDMSNIYDKELIELFKSVETSLKIEEGVYLGLKGPCYETPAEVQMCKILGANMIGMSTVLESLYANYLGKRILGVSLITNWAAGISDSELSHDEVKELADEKAVELKQLFLDFIRKI